MSESDTDFFGRKKNSLDFSLPTTSSSTSAFSDSNNYISNNLFKEDALSGLDLQMDKLKTGDTFNSDSMFGQTSEKSWLASDEFKNSMAAFSAISDVGNLYLGFKGLKLSEDQLKFKKKIGLANLNNNVNSYNSQLKFNLRDAGKSDQYDEHKLTA